MIDDEMILNAISPMPLWRRFALTYPAGQKRN